MSLLALDKRAIDGAVRLVAREAGSPRASFPRARQPGRSNMHNCIGMNSIEQNARKSPNGANKDPGG